MECLYAMYWWSFWTGFCFVLVLGDCSFLWFFGLFLFWLWFRVFGLVGFVVLWSLSRGVFFWFVLLCFSLGVGSVGCVVLV